MSHNTMGAFYSGTDDANELHSPGIHLVVGNIKHKPSPAYDLVASVVADHRRFHVPYEALIDTSIDNVVSEDSFHPNVLDNIQAYSNARKTEFTYNWLPKPKPAARTTRSKDVDDDDKFFDLKRMVESGQTLTDALQVADDLLTSMVITPQESYAILYTLLCEECWSDEILNSAFKSIYKHLWPQQPQTTEPKAALPPQGAGASRKTRRRSRSRSTAS